MRIIACRGSEPAREAKVPIVRHTHRKTAPPTSALSPNKDRVPRHRGAVSPPVRAPACIRPYFSPLPSSWGVTSAPAPIARPDQPSCSAAEFHVGEAPEGLIACEESRPEPTSGRVSDRVCVGQFRPTHFQRHRLEQPLVLRINRDPAKPSELTASFLLAPVPQHGQIAFHEIPDARPQLRGEESTIPRVPPDEFDQRVRVEEESGRTTSPAEVRLSAYAVRAPNPSRSRRLPRCRPGRSRRWLRRRPSAEVP